MIYRISEYHGLISKRNKLPIRHIVIYLGKNKSKMNLELKPQEVFKSFNLISLHEIDHNTLLSSQVPEIVILALLGRYEENEIERVLQAIVYRIQKLVDMEDDRKKYFKQLTILARIRKFEMNTYKIRNDDTKL